MIYLDSNATTAILPVVQSAVIEAIELGASNPSSSHSAGTEARRILTNARSTVAELIGASPTSIFFTSGATEANNWVLNSVTKRFDKGLVTSSIEHESIRAKAEMLRIDGIPVSEVHANPDGSICFEEVEKLLTDRPSLVSIQWVNNETGVIQPVEKIAELCRSYGVAFHTDAAQAAGKLIIDVSSIYFDYLSLSGHKFHAPMGVGVLYKRPGVSLPTLFGGGAQERGERPGTENLIGIAGIGAAALYRSSNLIETIKYLAKLRDSFEKLLRTECNELIINGEKSPRICNTSNIRFPGVDGDALVAQLDIQGIYCSKSSACTSQIPEPSHVLLAMGLTPEEANSSIRFSFSQLNDNDEVIEAVNRITKTYKHLKQCFSPSFRNNGS